jgi:hypothetical protein
MTRFAPQWLQQANYSAAVDRRLMQAIWGTGSPRTQGMLVGAATGMQVSILQGQAVVPSPNSTGSLLCTSDATEYVGIAGAPASGSNRIDLVILQVRGNDLDGGANNDFIFTTVTGTAAASPVAPATPAGALCLAQVYVAGGSVSITTPNLTDTRPGSLYMPTSQSKIWAMPWGIITPVAVVTANMTGIVGGAGRTDIPGMSCGPWTIVGNRQVRVTMALPQCTQQTAVGDLIVYITDAGNNVRAQARASQLQPAASMPLVAVYTNAATMAGGSSATWRGQVSTSGSGTASLTMSGTNPGTLIVEDIGPLPGTSPPPNWQPGMLLDALADSGEVL